MNKIYQQQQTGVAMVELAFILPFLILVLFGITELGRALYQQNTLYKSVAEGAHYLARYRGVLDDECVKQTSWDSAETTAINMIVYDIDSSPIIPNLDSEGAVTISVTSKTLTKTPVDGESVIEQVCVISVTAEADFASMFGDIVVPFSGIEAFVIRAETEERYIGL